jgi:hypothetical protein
MTHGRGWAVLLLASGAWAAEPEAKDGIGDLPSLDGTVDVLAVEDQDLAEVDRLESQLMAPGPAAVTGRAAAAVGSPVQGKRYYEIQPIYIPYPEPGRIWPMNNYGPVGIGLDLIDPAFTMRINSVENGSPAAATGKLKVGQIIESINGQTLKSIDPRVQLAKILGDVEATDGLMRLRIGGVGEVVVKLPVLGAYSRTWPLHCPKSDRIVRNLADLLARQAKPGHGSVIFLLSTGEEKDLDVVRGWMRDFRGVGSYPWFNGLEGPGVCEYYLRTGDAGILPAIKQMTEELRRQIYCGGWSGRGKAAFTYMAGGHMNAAGVHCLTFLLLARQCGVDVDEHTLQSALRHFYRFAGHGNVAYGDQLPEGGFRDNGKTAGLALAMAAAAQLTPAGEASVYAKARDNCAMKSFYATSWFNRAHTGGGIGEIWHSQAMQLMTDGKPAQYRSFMDERRWHYELSRRFNGGIGVHDGGGYDAPAGAGLAWGTYHALAYTAARKKLRLFGAPPTKWCKTYSLPERPWGTPADDAFLSNAPGEYRPGKVEDLSLETIPADASAVKGQRLLAAAASDEARDNVRLMLAHHPDYDLRAGAVSGMVAHQRDHLIVPLLRSADPRIRQAGLLALTGMFKGQPLPDNRVTDEMFELAGRMLEDPAESWWVAHTAMKALTRRSPEQIAPHVDRLLYFLGHEDWWLHTAAMNLLAKVATDKRFCKRVLPPVAQIVKNGQAFQSSAPAGAIVAALKTADPEVQALGIQLLADAYAGIPDPVVAPGGQITPSQTEVLRGRAYSFLQALPNTDAMLLKMPKLTSRWQATRDDADKFVYDGTFVANPAVLGTWTVVNLVPALDAFAFDTRRNPAVAPFTITFKDRGTTDSAQRMWTGDTLIDHSRAEVQKMTLQAIEVPPAAPDMVPDLSAKAEAAENLDLDLDAGTGAKTNRGKRHTAPYLFIEAGGFGGSKPTDWKTSYYVLKRLE